MTPDSEEPSSGDQRDVPTVRPRARRTHHVEGERFAPGALLAERYRIVGRIGRGGMGEVYRADDLKLGQPVALKFLPPALAADPLWLRRMHEEVRIAREIAHPNVCRTYDIGEAEGEHFITMEYVDGEDLESLLRRIGRLPKDKAIQIARQLCAGLAAAHDRGVLHRDLKPANVMLDGRGNVRITDFGIAAVAEQIAGAEIKAGTPAYMAPEQLAGEEVTVRSDVYSLGLLLYEIFTGREAFDAGSVADLQQLRRTTTPSSPSSFVEDMDPLVERVIMRCLEHDPARRPRSAIAVAAALPGGDPLALALAAGETPSPEMIAESGEAGGLRPAVAVSLLVAYVLLVALSVVLSDRASVLRRIPFDKSADMLVERATGILDDLGWDERPRDVARWFWQPYDYVHHVEETDQSPDRWAPLARGRPPGMRFTIRASAKSMTPVAPGGQVGWSDPPFTGAGSTRLTLDPEGRLLHLDVIAPDRMVEAPEGGADQQSSSGADQKPESGAGDEKRDETGEAEPPAHRPPALEPDEAWSRLFAAADLDRSAFEQVEPMWRPDVPCDTLAAWSGSWPGTEEPLRVEAGLWHGAPVHFRMLGAWNEPGANQLGSPPPWLITFFLTVILSVTVLGAVLAFRNLKAGRIDRRGAWRLAVYVFCASFGAWLFGADLSGGFGGYMMAAGGFGTAAGAALVCWLFYIAIEPYARRYWPHSIISWTRLLAGRFRDPLVGRDLLIGCVAAPLFFMPDVLASVIPRGGGAPPAAPMFLFDPAALLGGRRLIGVLFQAQTEIGQFLGAFVLLLLLRIVLRRQWLAVGAFFLIVAVPWVNEIAEGDVFAALAGAAFALLITVLLVRFGLLAFLAAAVCSSALWSFPITFDLNAWYATAGLVGLAALLVPAAYGFWTSLAGRPLFKEDLAAQG